MIIHFRTVARIRRNATSNLEFSVYTSSGGTRWQIHPFLFSHANIASQASVEFYSTHLQRRHASLSRTQDKTRLNAVIVGAGPSGFYTAKYLASSFSKLIAASQSGTTEDSSCSQPFTFSGIDIDIVERLPTPYGLVRYGVAPDHPEVKNVEKDFASVAEGYATGKDQYGDSNRQCTICYFGNVDVGQDISLQCLTSLYDIVVLAYGCQSDRDLGICGLDLQGVLSARQFVAWYNGHPEFGYVADIVRKCLWPNGKGNETHKISKARVVVIGNGNVALDCARVLVKGKHGLDSTDTPSSVLDVLDEGVEKVTVAGRRGHVQGAFTIKELRELTKLNTEGHNTSFSIRKDELDMGMTKASIQELDVASGRPKKRIDALLQVAASRDPLRDDAAKLVELRLLMNPVKIEHRNQEDEHVGQVVFERTKLEGETGKQQAVGTGDFEKVPADLVIISVGYKGEPLEGMDDNMFDNSRGIIPNNNGKVLGDNNIFATGWIKRGPTGIIGTNITDAKDTVSSIIKYITSEDQLSQIEANRCNGRKGLRQYLDSKGVKSISWDQYLQIDRAERVKDRLRTDSQEREKILSVEEMLAILN